ncbi:flavin monoamine oxidase family protein [Conexibacter sp. SYSU D00693]|uniref:flavin monoamine oxidase family protein n=1 Tax=Conexibacter sp. SYSU D00693 TaxID=2812560 RepID=UPI001F11B182|nr:flavin monoamine oxidase family protein [Conexibacter sp. SYSU D00693]
MSRTVTRRGLLGTAAGAAGAAALPPSAGAKPAPRRRAPRRTDVVVVGAGLAGLRAALDVVAAGRSVVVLEARDRVGGRLLNHALGEGEVIEVGGQWVGPTQDVLLGLARELGVDTFPTYDQGSYLYAAGGRRERYSPTGPLGPVPPDLLGAPEAFLAIAQLDQMAATVPVEAPWKAPRAAEWDSQTFETWKLANAHTPGARLLLDLAIEAVWACEPRDVSLLHVLAYIRGAGPAGGGGSLNRLINTAGGAQEQRFVGGSQRIVLGLAERLGKRRVKLGSPVRRVVQRKGSVDVVCDTATWRARSVVVTAPPAVTASIDWEPWLPADRAQLLQRFPQGNAIKCQAVYDEPFWRADGLAGQVTSDADPVRITFDNSPPDGRPGVLLGFIEGHAARVWARRSAADRKAAVLRCFADFFGDRASRPKAYVEMDWSAERWTRGCYVGFTPPGVLLDFGEAIRRPHQRVHWAGAETATVWNGYMDGALRSGSRAAAEALGDLA